MRMRDKPIAIGFNVPFNEAIASMEKRGIVLPDKYYGELQRIERQLAFSIAGVTSIDKLQNVLNSLTDKLSKGATFQEWQKDIRVQDLDLPRHRLDTIYRTNLQATTNRGRWEQFQQTKNTRKYLMYDAVNDSRTRPTHKAMDGIIRPIDDPFWQTHYPSNGYRCRCRAISLTEKQANDRSKNGEGLNKPITSNMRPDNGWDYNVGEDLTAGIDNAVADRMVSPSVHDKLKAVLNEKLAKSEQVVKFEIEKEMTKTTMIDKQAFADFVEKVTAEDYKARHEFVRVGTLPNFVMTDRAVIALEPINNEIYVSDHQLRHALRDVKTGKGTALPIDVTKNLPEKIESARWFYDSKFNNILAVFDIESVGFVGKSALAINFKKRKNSLNTIVTSGMIEEKILGMAIYREIVNTP